MRMLLKRANACKGAVDAETNLALRPECWVLANWSSPACNKDDDFGSNLMCATGAWGPGTSTVRTRLTLVQLVKVFIV